jgi:hypothetical protein
MSVTISTNLANNFTTWRLVPTLTCHLKNSSQSLCWLWFKILIETATVTATGISNRVFCNVGTHPPSCMATHYKRQLSWPPVLVLSFGRQNFTSVQNWKWTSIFVGHAQSEINEDTPLLGHTTKNIDDEGGQYICHPQNGNTPADVWNIATAARLTKLNSMSQMVTTHTTLLKRLKTIVRCSVFMRFVTNTDYCPKQH